MKSVFADTFFYLALIDDRDEHHKAVVDYVVAAHDFIVTTRWVLIELANAVSSTDLRADVVELMQVL